MAGTAAASSASEDDEPELEALRVPFLLLAAAMAAASDVALLSTSADMVFTLLFVVMYSG
jgi:hypothetical protein